MSIAPLDPPSLHAELEARFGPVPQQTTKDNVPTWWLPRERVAEALSFLRNDQHFEMLFDMTAIDETRRTHREGQPDSDVTLVWHLLSVSGNRDVRVKTALSDDDLSCPTTSGVFPNANWYEREVLDLFGVQFPGHPDPRRILMPPTWKGHPLRKDHPARATEMPPYSLTDDQEQAELEALRLDPSQWGLADKANANRVFLNLGPHHPGTHGLLRILLELDGETINECVPDIGWHHRGAEKMGERQTWHSYIPYTDRVDYFSGVLNNLAYLNSLERLAGIVVPDRAKVIRVMMSELFRVCSHLVWLGTFAGDLGALTPVFFMFTDREKAFDIVEAVTGGRMHPGWFRMGGTAQDLPMGWEQMMRNFLAYLPPRLREYQSLVMESTILKARTQGIGTYSKQDCYDWGVTGAGLRATGVPFDVRKARPYSGFEWFEFDVPVATNGDCYARAEVRMAELWQSLRIIEQCVNNMPSGPYKADHPLTTPPPKERTMKDIETLIHHFLGVSWGPVVPEGEACLPIESSKGMYGYYLVSDRNSMSYRTRIRTPSFAHMQTLPTIARGGTVSDLLAILGAMDFILADLDR
jgi:NADH-quinone oxidoreductase subunit C/D